MIQNISKLFNLNNKYKTEEHTIPDNLRSKELEWKLANFHSNSLLRKLSGMVCSSVLYLLFKLNNFEMFCIMIINKFRFSFLLFNRINFTKMN